MLLKQVTSARAANSRAPTAFSASVLTGRGTVRWIECCDRRDLNPPDEVDAAVGVAENYVSLLTRAEAILTHIANTIAIVVDDQT